MKGLPEGGKGSDKASVTAKEWSLFTAGFLIWPKGRNGVFSEIRQIAWNICV